jgi:hypothetical protein
LLLSLLLLHVTHGLALQYSVYLSVLFPHLSCPEIPSLPLLHVTWYRDFLLLTFSSRVQLGLYILFYRLCSCAVIKYPNNFNSSHVLYCCFSFSLHPVLFSFTHFFLSPTAKSKKLNNIQENKIKSSCKNERNKIENIVFRKKPICLGTWLVLLVSILVDSWPFGLDLGRFLLWTSEGTQPFLTLVILFSNSRLNFSVLLVSVRPWARSFHFSLLYTPKLRMS